MIDYCILYTNIWLQNSAIDQWKFQLYSREPFITNIAHIFMIKKQCNLASEELCVSKKQCILGIITVNVTRNALLPWRPLSAAWIPENVKLSTRQSCLTASWMPSYHTTHWKTFTHPQNTSQVCQIQQSQKCFYCFSDNYVIFKRIWLIAVQ